MLIYARLCTVVEFNLFIEKIYIAEFFYYRVCGERHPDGVIREFSVAYRAVDYRSRSIAGIILICKDAFQSFPCKARIYTRKTFRIACKIAISVMADSCPSAAHIGGVFHPAVYKLVEVSPRSAYLNTAKSFFIFVFHSGKFFFDLVRRKRGYAVFIIGKTEREMNRLFLTGEKRHIVLQNKTKLFGVAVRVLTFKSFFKRRRMLFVAVRSDKSVSS